MNKIHKITHVQRLPSTVSNGPMVLTLEGGKKSHCPENCVAGIVPTVGDFAEDVPVSAKYPNGLRIFQFYKVVRDRGPLRLSDGSPLPSPHPHDVAAKEGDYYIRRTDGMRLIQRYRFEAEHASVLEALRAREACST